MSTREYIGARYVPVFADPAEWDATKTYEPLTVVLYQGNSYTSRQAVPANIPITNETYWAQTGNYNAQVEQYRQEVTTFDSRIASNAAAIEAAQAESQAAIEAAQAESQAAIEAAQAENQAAIEAAQAENQAAIEALGTAVDADVDEVKSVIPFDSFSAENTVKDYVDNANASMEVAQNNRFRVITPNDITFTSAYTVDTSYTRISGVYDTVAKVLYLGGLLQFTEELSGTNVPLFTLPSFVDNVTVTQWFYYAVSKKDPNSTDYYYGDLFIAGRTVSVANVSAGSGRTRQFVFTNNVYPIRDGISTT